MAKISPGGSGVTRVFPASLAGGGTGDLKWQEAYSVDWSEEDAHNFESGGDGALTIDGVAWTALNDGADVATNGLRTDGSNGLCIWPDGDERIWDTDVESPMVTVLVKDAVGAKTTYDMNKHAVCFQCTFTATQDISNQWDFIGAICMNSQVGTGNLNVRYLNVGGYSDSGTSGQRRTVRTKSAEAHHSKGPTADTALTDRNLLQIIIWPGQDYIGSIVGSVGTMPGGGFPDPNNWAPGLTGALDLSTSADGSTFTLANLRFGMVATAEQGSAPDPNPIFTECRVMYMEMI